MAKVMIVDDAAFMRASIKKMIEEDGFEVIAEASDGAEAIDLYRKVSPDVVTMDITMPNMTGIEALKKIREIDGKATVIMVTAMGQEAMIKESVISGAASFIVKPFQKEKLVEVLRGALK